MSFIPYMYIPSLTLPSQVFTSPAVAILVPIAPRFCRWVCNPTYVHPNCPTTSHPTRCWYLYHSIHTARATKQVYAAIRQPPLRPPAWVFGPVWAILYGIILYAAHRATASGLAHPDPSIRNPALAGTTAYTCQLGLNLVWMPLFFGLGRPALALADIVTLAANVGPLAVLWSKWDIMAAYLMVPYLSWLGFVTYITVGVGVLNDWNIPTVEERN